MCVYCYKGPPDSLDLVAYLQANNPDNQAQATQHLFDQYWSSSCDKSQRVDGWKLTKWGMYWTDHATAGE